MAWKYERLSAQDTSFLLLEDENACLHVASVGIFERGPLAAPDGGVDFEKIERFTEALLPRVPRYRQKLQWIPLQSHPVWVDDPVFNLHYHLRHTALPRPGSERQLKRMAARVMSQPLDHTKPLWETWVVEGLEGDRFAMIQKIHHCMIDGMSGVDLANKMMSSVPGETEPGEPRPYVPRAAPSGRELLTDELVRRATQPLSLLARLAAGGEHREPDDGGASWRSRARSIGETLRQATEPTEDTPLNADIGPHRRFDWLAMDLLEVRAVRKALGGSINDVVLAIVTGAVRRFFLERGADPDSGHFKAMTPVSVRDASERHALGNRVSAWLVDLPIDEPDPARQLERVVERTAELKRSQQAVGTDLLMQATDWLPGVLFALGARAAGSALPFNMVVTNVPGPQHPWYLLGARLLESYGMVPLIGRQGLGVALGSYDGRLFWGFNADWEIVPDLHDFVNAVGAAFDDLCGAAGVKRGVAAAAGADPASLLATGG
ncbi:MAG: WS/DGAT/MGAT family O-acyltransferase [Myxococcota bacterium]